MHCSTEQNAFDNIERISVKKEETSSSSERDSVSELKMCTQSNTALDIESENQEFANATYIDSKPSYDVSNVAENLTQSEDSPCSVEQEEYDQISTEVSEESTGHQGNLGLHRQSVQDGVKHSCDVRDRKFAQKSNLKTHTESVHKHTCEICNMNFTKKYNMMRHKDSVHDGVKYSCEICNMKFTKKSGLRRHKESVHDGVKYSCDICQNLFSDTSCLLIHKKSVHGGVKYSCENCDKKFTHRSGLWMHKQNVHDGVKHSCEICNKSFSRKMSLTKHKKKVHVEGN